jgi:hypothetical protein
MLFPLMPSVGHAFSMLWIAATVAF